MPFFTVLLVDVKVDRCFFFECFGCTPAAPVCSEGARPAIAVLLKGSELAKPMDGAVTSRGPFISVPTMELLRPASHNPLVSPSLTENNSWISI
jgi:hypothetical protein